MTPDYERAAIKAAEILIQHNVGTAPVAPFPILKKTPGVLVMSFQEMSASTHIDRKDIINMFGQCNQDAVTTVFLDGDEVRYIVSYNQMLSVNLFQRALARELGHIVLGHDGSRPEEVRNAEAICFANHLLCPRPLIHAIQASGIRLTTEVLGNITGCYDHCLNCMRRLPAVSVPAEMNRAIREQFAPYIFNFFEFQRHAMLKDGSALADFGTFMDGYEE